MRSKEYPNPPEHTVSGIQYLFLTMLMGGAKTDEDIVQQLQSKIQWSSHSPITAVHTLLRRFEKQRLIFSTNVNLGAKEIKIYQITREGYLRWKEQFDFYKQVIELCEPLSQGRHPDEFPELRKDPLSTTQQLTERAPTEEEQQKILKAGKDDFQEIYQFSLLSKTRAHDLVNARIESLSLKEKTLTLEPKSVTGRTIEHREIELTPEMIGLLRRVVGSRPTGNIFKRLSGRNWDASTLSASFKTARSKAGVSNTVVLSGRGGKIGKMTEEE